MIVKRTRPTRRARVGWARYCCAALLPFILTTETAAQREVRIDIGGARVRYADTLDITTLALAPAVNLETRLASVRAGGTISQLDLGGWTTQGMFDAALRTPFFGPFQGEVTSALGGSMHRDGTRTGQLLGGLRAHVAFQQFGLFGGGSLGGSTDGDVWRGVRQAELGAWLTHRRFALLLTLTPTEVQDTIDYADATLSFIVQSGRLELAAVSGLRRGDRLPTLGGTERAWGTATLVAWLTRRMALVAAAGTYPVDLTQGFPGGRFVSMGARLRTAPRAPVSAASAPLTAPGAVAADGAAVSNLEAKSGWDDQVTLRLHAVRAQRVEIAADFTNWQPMQLTATGNDWWTVTLPITSGTHQINARVNGGPWIVPRGMPAVTDEFGGRVGILVIPSKSIPSVQ
ncbi:MAG: glycogen-binding domain-containing protein [Longimicrobiales bacterium]